jgi:fatty acid desaturase
MERRQGLAANWVLLALLGACTLFALIALPLWLLPRNPWWGLALVPVALATNSFWALHHEAIHGNFHPARRINHLSGRAMAVLLGSSFRVLRFAHLMHHRYNRYRLDRPDIYETDEGPYAIAKLRFLSELLLLLYLSEVVVPLLCLLPKPGVRRIVDFVYRHPDPTVRVVKTVAEQVFLRDRNLREIRVDALVVIGLVTVSAICYGPFWPMLAAFLLARGIAVSVIDNVYHFATPVDDVDFAMNLRLSAPLQFMFLNMNLHRVHHHNPELTWWQLPDHFRQRADTYDAGFIATALRQFTGPVPPRTTAPLRA